MCRWLAYSGKPIFLDSLLFEPENSLIEQSLHASKTTTTINGDGFGLGWYGERDRPGLYRDILPAWNDSNLKSIAHQIQSGLFFAHVRASTGTPISRENCHPFSYKNWMFMHNGQIGNYDTVRHDLEMSLEDKLYAHRLGSSDSELIFLLMINNGLETNPIDALKKTVCQILAAMNDKSADEPLRFTACLSNETETIAVRFANDEMAPSLYMRNTDDQIIIASEPLNPNMEGGHCTRLAQSQYIHIRNGETHHGDFHP